MTFLIKQAIYFFGFKLVYYKIEYFGTNKKTIIIIAVDN